LYGAARKPAFGIDLQHEELIGMINEPMAHLAGSNRGWLNDVCNAWAAMSHFISGPRKP
jgi:hypothetical protein